ncbi:restriction endonuclease subunit S [Thiolapillus sp.]|uniref:restriction endonuclease subunit S n=1 Tax=Thiolapillus sp. TaxID=2017437 RepID=UPI003AF7FB26
MLQPVQQTPVDVLKPYTRASNIQPDGIDISDVKEMWFSPVELRSLRLIVGDLLVSEGGDVGRAAIWREELSEAYYQNSINRIRSKGTNHNSYLYYLLSSIKEAGAIDIVCNRLSIAHLTAEKLNALHILYPPSDEQPSIAKFLDHQTTHIDQLIEKKTRFIKLLKEKRTALITEAVTGKFDMRTGKPYAEYKGSRVQWLGEVPAHWGGRRLKFVVRYQNSNVDKKSYEGQKNVRLCNYTDVYYNEKITNNMDFMVATATDAEIKSMSLKEGDVVITKDSEDPADIGIPAIISEPLDNVVCGYHLTVLRTKEPDAARYLHRAIQSHPSRAHFFVESPGVTRFGLNQEAIGGLTIPVPPIVERNQIAAFLDKNTTHIDQLIEKTQQSIDLLKEKRTALITAAVTGKIDVRDYVEYNAA